MSAFLGSTATPEDPGVIADDKIGTSQLAFLEAALNRVRTDKFAGALLIADHHPPYTAGSRHGWSTELLAQIDSLCQKTGFGRMRFSQGTLTTINGSRGRARRMAQRSPTSFAAMGDIMCNL